MRHPPWRRTPPLKRARILFAYKALLDKHAERIVAAIVEGEPRVLARKGDGGVIVPSAGPTAEPGVEQKV